MKHGTLALLALSALNAVQGEITYHPQCRPQPTSLLGPYVRLEDGSVLVVWNNRLLRSADGGRKD